MNTKTPKPAKTRQAILNRLKQIGPRTAPALAKDLGITPMAVRLHLYDLAAEKLIDFEQRSQGRGRPAKFWQLTSAAQHIFPDAHQGLAVDLINSVRQAFGQKGLDAVVTANSKKQLANYKEQLLGIESLPKRLQGLAKIRSAEGYMAGARQDGADWLFYENHCPICAAAKTCTKLCANELWVFEQVLGPELNITREEHILGGARRCLYRISAKN